MKVNSYKELIVWQKSIQLAKSVYFITNSFPKEELYGLVSQLRRASVSIPSNIAEGQARNSTGEFLQFLGIAKGSIAELETQIYLSKELNFINENSYEALRTQAEEVHKMLHGLISSINEKKINEFISN